MHFWQLVRFFFWVWALYSICTQPPINFTEQKIIDLKSVQWNQSKLHSYFLDAEYLLVGFSSASCSHCAEKASWMNSNTEFKNKVSWEWSCEFITLVHDEPDPSKALTDRLNNPLVSWNTSFVWSRSRIVVDAENTWYTTPTPFWWPVISGTPTFMIINRQWQMVAMKQWDLPSLFNTLCVANSCNWEWNPPSTWNIDEPWGWSCPWGGWWTNAGWTNAGWANAGWTSAGWANAGWTNAGWANAGWANAGWTNAGWTNAGWANAGWANAGWTSAGWANAGWTSAGWTNAGWANAGWTSAGWTNAGWASAGWTSAGWTSAGWTSAGWTSAGWVIWNMRPWRVQLEIPITNWLQTDIVAKQKELNSWNSKESLKWFFRILNEWMWMLLMLVLFIAVIYAWYTLLTSVWDSEKMKTGLRMLLYVVFWLVIAILSWAVISLIAWMFA